VAKKDVHFAVYFFACEMSAFLENSFGWGRLVVVFFVYFDGCLNKVFYRFSHIYGLSETPSK